GAGHGARGELAPLQTRGERGLQQPPGILERARARELLGREREQGFPRECAGARVAGADESLGGAVEVVRLRLDRTPGQRFAAEVEPVTEDLEQPLLEDAQARLERRAAAQRAERGVVVIEQRRQRVVARGELHHQLVQVKRREQYRRRQRRAALRALRRGELRGLPATAPGQQ